MLTNLRISNFAIIDELDIKFDKGLTVLTGETGAGKSIIAEALNFLLGARGSIEMIKASSQKAEVEGDFYFGDFKNKQEIKDWLNENSFESQENNYLYISREITQNGSKARINGSMANVSHLAYLKNYFLNTHEQSEHIELLKNEKQLEIFDNYGDSKHCELLTSYKKAFEGYQSSRKKLNLLSSESEQLEKEISELTHEITEIEAVEIKGKDEDKTLTEKREIILNRKELIDNSGLIYELINSEDPSNLSSTLFSLRKSLSSLCKYDKSFQEKLESVEEIILKVKDLSSFIYDYNQSISYQDEDLKGIEERLDLFFKLKRKYGKTLEEVLEHKIKAKQRLKELKEKNLSANELEDIVQKKETNLNNLAKNLTLSRERIKKSFVEQITSELLSLGFSYVSFLVSFEECELYEAGQERVQFLISTNPDESLRPLLKVASGGELSRIMLAIKSITKNNAVRSSTMIFDEVDIGVSGEIASSVGKKLFKLSTQNQILCITHQPIICAMADHHFLIQKDISSGITKIKITNVNNEKRIDALAYLLTPDKLKKDGITEDAKQFARSLIENAIEIKKKEKNFIFAE